MKAFALLCALFVATVNCYNLQDYRVLNEPSTSDIIEIVDKTRGTEFFGSIITLPDSVVNTSHPPTVRKAVNCTDKNLKILRARFSLFAYNYVTEQLESYRSKLIESVGKSNGHVAADRRIAFGVQDMCAISFLYHSRMPVDKQLEFALLLRTLPDVVDRDSLLKQFKALVMPKPYYTIGGHNVEPTTGPSDDVDAARAMDEILKIKNNFTELSGRFCLSAVPPVVFKDILMEKQVDESTDNFIRYLYRGEKIVVNFVPNFSTKQQQLAEYSATAIEIMPEYRIEEYMNDVEVDSSTRRRVLLNGRNDDRGTTLESLKSTLTKSNYYYFNLVKYPNVLSETVFYVLIKEASKSLTLVHHWLSKRCKNRLAAAESMQVYEIHSIRSKLFALKWLVDDFFNRLSKIIPLTRLSSTLKSFKRDVNNAIGRLSIPENTKFDDYLTALCAPMSTYSMVKKDVHLGRKPNEIFLQEYYLYGPIINVYKLLSNFDMLYSNVESVTF